MPQREWWDGKRLKRAREQQELTQEELARKVEVHQVTIARLETGARRPSVGLLQQLAKALKVDLDDLLK